MLAPTHIRKSSAAEPWRSASGIGSMPCCSTVHGLSASTTRCSLRSDPICTAVPTCHRSSERCHLLKCLTQQRPYVLGAVVYSDVIVFHGGGQIATPFSVRLPV